MGKNLNLWLSFFGKFYTNRKKLRLETYSITGMVKEICATGRYNLLMFLNIYF